MTIQECECGYVEFYVDVIIEDDGYNRIHLICRDCGKEHSIKPTVCDGVFVSLEDAKER